MKKPIFNMGKKPRKLQDYYFKQGYNQAKQEFETKIKGWEKLFEEEQTAREQAQEEVRKLRKELDNKNKDFEKMIDE